MSVFPKTGFFILILLLGAALILGFPTFFLLKGGPKRDEEWSRESILKLLVVPFFLSLLLVAFYCEFQIRNFQKAIELVTTVGIGCLVLMLPAAVIIRFLRRSGIGGKMVFYVIPVLGVFGGFFSVVYPDLVKHGLDLNRGSQAREKACFSNMRTILGAIESFGMGHGFPECPVPGPVPFDQLMKGGVLKEIPVCDDCERTRKGVGYWTRKRKTDSSLPPETLEPGPTMKLPDDFEVFCPFHGAVPGK